MATPNGEDTRVARGFSLYRAGAVSPNGGPGSFYVASASHPLERYTVKSFWAANGMSCTCPDYEHRGLPCKHVWAASLADAQARIAEARQAGRTDKELLAAIGQGPDSDELTALKASALMAGL